MGAALGVAVIDYEIRRRVAELEALVEQLTDPEQLAQRLAKDEGLLTALSARLAADENLIAALGKKVK